VGLRLAPVPKVLRVNTAKPVNWGDYLPCPYCFRTWDCRKVLKQRPRICIGYQVPMMGNPEAKVWKRFTLQGSIGGWGDWPLKRPHNGRRKREKMDR
jgi:hypothetical protein